MTTERSERWADDWPRRMLPDEPRVARAVTQYLERESSADVRDLVRQREQALEDLHAAFLCYSQAVEESKQHRSCTHPWGYDCYPDDCPTCRAASERRDRAYADWRACTERLTEITAQLSRALASEREASTQPDGGAPGE